MIDRIKVIKSTTGEMVTLDAVLRGWKDFYRENFELDLDPPTVRIPETRAHFDRLLVIVKGITLSRVLRKYHHTVYGYFDDCLPRNKARFPQGRKWWDDETNLVNDRDPTNGSYAIWVRGKREAKGFRNKSADEVRARNITGITLLERAIFEVKSWSERRTSLDWEHVTLCTGSRFESGWTPIIHLDCTFAIYGSYIFKITGMESDRRFRPASTREVIA
jgi:hypothetical protein